MKSTLKFLSLTACLVPLLSGSAYAAAAANDWYLGGSGDVTWISHAKTGGGGNVMLGYRMSDFRLEAQAGYHGASGDAGYSSTHYFTYMGNAYYDFNSLFPAQSSSWHIAPFIGGGLGDAAIHRGASSFSTTFRHHDNKLAWQGMTGLNFTAASMPQTDWTIGYRYLGTDGGSLHANNLELGVRFHF